MSDQKREKNISGGKSKLYSVLAIVLDGNDFSQ